VKSSLKITIFGVLYFLIFSLSPASAEFKYTFPVSGCKTTFPWYHHDYPAADIKARMGCAFVAPIGGVVQDVSRKDLWSGKTNLGKDRGGLSVSIIGDDGVRYYGSHLSKVEKGIEPGMRVEIGQKLGEIGRTGSARGIPRPHLHFGISYQTEPGDWEIRRGAIKPWKYLESWKKGENLSPVAEVTRAKKKAGK
jgi:murein DD-endopeptidase MepM/ murein hydrolase activator NlpD